MTSYALPDSASSSVLLSENIDGDKQCFNLSVDLEVNFFLVSIAVLVSKGLKPSSREQIWKRY